VGEVQHPECKITIFAWNNRYLIKLEQHYFEQTFKIDQFDVDDEDHLKRIVNAEFIQHALTRFQDMRQSFYEAVQKSAL
ncbi:MAG: hypothetical protein ACOYXT_24600, partial [Bacteroidota bacterium]